MRVLFALDNFAHRTGGAEKSMGALAAGLAAGGDEVRVLQRGEKEDIHEWQGIPVASAVIPEARFLRDRDLDTLRDNRAWEDIAYKAIREHAPDVVVTQHWLSPSTVRAAVRAGVPAVSFVHAYGPFCATQFKTRDALHECDRRCFRCLPLRYKIKYPFVRQALDLYEEALKSSRLVVVNSIYVQRVIEKFYGLSSALLYPVADVKAYAVAPGSHNRLLFVKPQYVKGLPTFLKVARMMPDVRFTVVGHARRHLARCFARLGNVEHMGWVDDMQSVYGRTSVLFAPAIWPEPFGRVFVEAGMSGIPSVASNVGGIPEAVGDGGILVDNRFSPSAWVEALRAAAGSERRPQLAAAARAHAETFVAMDLVGRFRSMLADLRATP